MSPVLSCNFPQSNVEPISAVSADKDSLSSSVRLNEDFLFLEFGSDTDLMNTYHDLINNREALEAFEKGFDGFVSQEKAYDMIDSEEEYQAIVSNLHNHAYKGFLIILEDPTTREMMAERVVTSPVFAHLINKDGMLKVGNMVQRFTYDKVLSMVNPSPNQIQQMIDWDDKSLPSFSTDPANTSLCQLEGIVWEPDAQTTHTATIGNTDAVCTTTVQ